MRLTQFFNRPAASSPSPIAADPLRSLEAQLDVPALLSQLLPPTAPIPHFSGTASSSDDCLLRILIIQALFDLDDTQLLFQLHDRSSFQRFARCPRADTIPGMDEIARFRARLARDGAPPCLLTALQTQLQPQGHAILCGRSIDPALVATTTTIWH